MQAKADITFEQLLKVVNTLPAGQFEQRDLLEKYQGDWQKY